MSTFLHKGEITMPILDGRGNYGDDENTSRNRLTEEALILSAGLAAGYTIMHKPLLAEELVPELGAMGRTAAKSLKLGLPIEETLAASKVGFQSLAADTAGSVQASEKLVEKGVLKSVMTGGDGAAPELAANIQLGANYAPEYAARHQALDPQYLGFTHKWPVEGVNIHDQGVNIVVTKNGHWVKMSNFEKPTADIHGLDILNTRVSRVSTYMEHTIAGEKQMTRVELELGKRDPVVLKGPVSAVEFWYQ